MLSQRPSVLVFMLICFGLFGWEVFSQKSEDVETKFMDYIVQFNKSYRFDAGEYSKRFITFKVSGFCSIGSSFRCFYCCLRHHGK